jgi:XTP/dITP diphosphohydrolase
MQRIILATRNAGKVAEIRAILGGLPFAIESVADHPGLPEVEENGVSLEENALKKAREIYRASGLTALSDDTGLEVFALGLRPGVVSARYAGKEATYADNNRKLLAELAGSAADRRTARFRCVAALVGEGIETITTGICHGRIIDAPRGEGGFGYDPIFVPDGYDRTFAELPADVKNEISHRAKAFREMRKVLARIGAPAS